MTGGRPAAPRSAAPLAVAAAILAGAVGLVGCAGEQAFRRAATPDERAEGDRLAARMIEALGGQEAYDRIEVIQFAFVVEAGVGVLRREHAWDKARGLHRFTTGDTVVYTDRWAPAGSEARGVAFEGGVEVSDPEARRGLLDEAHEAFINDTYWLLAPFKVFDDGAQRAAIDGDLRLTFDDGVGLTSGDAYLFRLQESGRPAAWSFDLESGLRGTFAYEGAVELEGVTFFTERPSGFGPTIRLADLEVSTEPRPDLFGPLAGRRADLAPSTGTGP